MEDPQQLRCTRLVGICHFGEDGGGDAAGNQSVAAEHAHVVVDAHDLVGAFASVVNEQRHVVCFVVDAVQPFQNFFRMFTGSKAAAGDQHFFLAGIVRFHHAAGGFIAVKNGFQHLFRHFAVVEFA